jgi:hypothetical protein
MLLWTASALRRLQMAVLRLKILNLLLGLLPVHSDFLGESERLNKHCAPKSESPIRGGFRQRGRRLCRSNRNGGAGRRASNITRWLQAAADNRPRPRRRRHHLIISTPFPQGLPLKAKESCLPLEADRDGIGTAVAMAVQCARPGFYVACAIAASARRVICAR